MGRALRDSVDPVSLNFWRWLIALAPFALPGLAAKRRDPRECRLPAVPRRHGRDALITIPQWRNVGSFQRLDQRSIRPCQIETARDLPRRSTVARP